MKVSYKWLQEYVDLGSNIVETADALTLSGSKVEEVIENGKEIDKVVTGKILKIEKHPDAEKLVVCTVDVKDEILQIVTGADNIREGDIVPVALHGSSLPGGVKIRKGKLRGVESNGMLCSETELGIAGEESIHGIMILDKNTPIGVDIKQILGLDGGVIDFEITSNRSDCYGLYGIAREASATFKKPLKDIEVDFKENNENINDYLSVEIQSDLCRRYNARMVKNIKIKPSPEWMQQRLKDCGVRAINNIVDITNYVMLELGQPLHSFDYRYIGGKKIIVKRAQDGEKFVTLDGNERTLDSSMLVIADAEKPVAVAGVMGGENSEVLDDTQTIVFESANFNGPNIRITAKKLGLRTEASAKFEKDLDPNLAETALKRACHLIEITGSGEIVGGEIDIYPKPVKPWTVEVSPKWVNEFLGVNIETSRMKEILESLMMKVEGDEILKIEVPTFRQDVVIKEDVAEEIARIYGYDIIPSVKIHGEAVEAVKTPEQKLTAVVRNTMASCGLYEALTYSFTSPKVFDYIKLPKDDKHRNTVVISNPLGEDFSVMKTTTIPSMMDNLSRNYSRDNKNVKLFEVSRVYIPTGDVLPDERDILSIGMYGDVDFYSVKGIVEKLLSTLGIDKAEFVRETESPVFHPGRCAKLQIRKKQCGIFGEVHPDVAQNYGIDDKVFIAEVDLKTLFDAARMDRKYKHLPKFPSTSRDIAMLISDNVMVSEIENIIKKYGKELIEEIKLFDVYKGKQIPQGMKSVAYSIIYRADNRTLKDEEVNRVHDNIVNALKEKLGAQLR